MARDLAITTAALAAVLFALGYIAATSQWVGVACLWGLAAILLLISIVCGIRASLTRSLTPRRRRT